MYISRVELEDVLRRYRLSAQRFWVRDPIVAVWDREKMIVPETAAVYPYVLKARIGIEVEYRQDRLATTGRL